MTPVPAAGATGSTRPTQVGAGSARLRRLRRLRPRLDALYDHYAHPAFLSSDPLEFVLPYTALGDREIAAFFAAGLAYGHVVMIRHSVADLLRRLGPSPAAFVDGASPAELAAVMHGFQHRWTRADEVVSVLLAMQRMRREFPTLGHAFRAGHRTADATILPALTAWTGRLRGSGPGRNSLVADPAAGSACKRLCLFLRWMVRRDSVDPGGWEGIRPAQLVAPIDVHMFRMARRLGLTRRRTVSLRTALAVTDALRVIHPEDPLRYDFALTRPGILRRELPWSDA